MSDAIAAHPTSIPCNTYASSFWAQPSAKQQTGDFPHSIPQNRRANVSGTEAGQSFPQASTLATQRKRAGTKPDPFTTASVAYGSDSIGSNSTDSRGSGKRQQRSLPSCSAGASDSAIFSISFSERLERSHSRVLKRPCQTKKCSCLQTSSLPVYTSTQSYIF